MGILDFLKTGNRLEELEKIEISYNLGEAFLNPAIHEIFIGDLHLPSGKIIVSDPFYTHVQKPFVKTVAPGTYPVYLYMKEIDDGHYRVAFAKIKIRQDHVDKWILALTEDTNPADVYDMDDEEYFGFFVEAGLACFVDVYTNEEYLKTIDQFYAENPDLNYYDDILAEEFDQCSSSHPYSRDLGDWNNHRPVKDKDSNLMMFASGWGDGYYPCYWGINDQKQVIELIVDFMLEEQDVD